MGPSAKHVLGVLEWSYVVPKKPCFSSKKREWFRVTPPPPTGLAKHQTFYVIFLNLPLLSQVAAFGLRFFSESFPQFASLYTHLIVNI